MPGVNRCVARVTSSSIMNLHSVVRHLFQCNTGQGSRLLYNSSWRYCAVLCENFSDTHGNTITRIAERFRASCRIRHAMQ